MIIFELIELDIILITLNTHIYTIGYNYIIIKYIVVILISFLDFLLSMAKHPVSIVQI